jgi:hypothetical protein
LPRPLHKALRFSLVIALAICACFSWSLALDAFEHVSQERLAFRILLGDSFPVDIVSPIQSTASSADDAAACHPSLRRALVVLDLDLFEDAFASADRSTMDDRLGRLENSVSSALTCTPTDAFLWCLRYWVKNLKYGFNGDILTDLKMSYQLGPNEGWIAARRNRFALAVFDRLSLEMQDKVVAEYAGMVNAGMIQKALDNLVGPGRPIQDRLLNALSDTRTINREWLAKSLRQAGYRINVPGIELSDERPWR